MNSLFLILLFLICSNTMTMYIEKWLQVRNTNGKVEVINLEFVRGIKEYPYNKKGVAKSLV